jgi:hypothetical protein
MKVNEVPKPEYIPKKPEPEFKIESKLDEIEVEKLPEVEGAKTKSKPVKEVKPKKKKVLGIF